LVTAIPLSFIFTGHGAHSNNADNADTFTVWPPGEGALEEIVVTALRRSERLVDVPLSASAISGETLIAQDLAAVSSLAYTTPGYLSSNGLATRRSIFGVWAMAFS
jgi:outer membrane receptor protein involved in Fe transport